MRKCSPMRLLQVVGATILWLVSAETSLGVDATYSSPIALTSDDRFLWVVNPDDNSVSQLQVDGDANIKVREIKVGVEPSSVAITPDNAKVYVTNAVSGTVSVINAQTGNVTRILRVGTEPYGAALSPDGHSLYVTNSSSNSLTIIDTQTDSVRETIANIGVMPRGIAVTQAADGNNVYITQFLAQLRSDGRTVDQKEGRDDGKEGRVTFLHDGTTRSTQTIVVNPVASTGSNSNGSTLDRIPPTNPATFATSTGAFPNLLQSVVVKGDRAYLPNVGSSPNGPVGFNVNVQGFLSSIDTITNADTNQTLNMNRGVQFEPADARLFNANPNAIAFKNGSNEGFAVLGGTDRLVRVTLDAQGAASINAPTSAGQSSDIVRVPVGKSPQGIAINSGGTRAYVTNRVSRDVSVVDVGAADPKAYHEIARVSSAELPAAGTLKAILLRGQELFNTAIGPPGTQLGSQSPAGRMSMHGSGSCSSCHPSGRSDGVTWMFEDGPRQTISMEGTGVHPQPTGSMTNSNGAPLLPSFKQRVLNWSATRDEIQDSELKIRGISGGEGLITDGQPVDNLRPTANTGRSPDLDALAAYVTRGIRAPISPLRQTNVGGGRDVQISQGRALFASANCQGCHSGANWSKSRVDFTPPPAAGQVVDGQLVAQLNSVGTFDSSAFNEVRSSGTTVTTSKGALGFNTPSLLSVFASAPYFHNGAAPSLDDLMQNVSHRSAGTGGVDTLSSPVDRARLVKFLQSIDANTRPFSENPNLTEVIAGVPGFVPIAQPDAAYLAQSSLLEIAGDDLTAVSSLSVGGLTLKFDVDLVALSAQNTWSTWGVPPNVENTAPRVLWTNGFTELTITSSNPLLLLGLEIQPETLETAMITAMFMNGSDFVGEITQIVDGEAGARLFAAMSSQPFDRVLLFSSDAFGIAQLRVIYIPEPSTLVLLLLGTAFAKRVRLRPFRASSPQRA